LAEKELKIKISVDAKTGDLKIVSGEFEKIERAGKKADDGIASLKKTLLGIGATVGGVITLAKGFELLKDAVDVTSQFEQFEAVLTTIEGSSLKAKGSLAWIEEFAKKTPYQLDQVTDAFVKLKAYGLEAKDGLLKTLGDTAAAMGKDLNQAVEAMADAVMGENERLKEFGIKASATAKEITYRWSDASGKAKKITVANNKEIIQSTLEAIFNSKYAGAMNKMSQTWKGLVSNMSDSWTKFKKDLMQKSGLFDDLKKVLKSFSDYFKDHADGWVKSFSDFYQYIKQNSNIFDPFIDAAKDVWDVANEVFSDVWSIVKTVFSDAWNWIKKTFGIFSDESSEMTKVLAILGGLFKGAGLSIKNFTTVVKIAYKELKMWGDYIGTTFRRSFAKAQLEWEKAILGMYEAMDKIPFADYTKEIAEQTKAVQLQTIAVDKITDSYNIRNAAGEAEILTLRGEIKSYDEIKKEMKATTKQLSTFSTSTKKQTVLNTKNEKTLKAVKGAVDDMGTAFDKNGKKSAEALRKLEEANRKAYEANLKIWLDYFEKTGNEEAANQIKRYQAAVKFKDQLKGIEGDMLNDQLDMLAGITKAHEKEATELEKIWKNIGEDIEKSIDTAFKNVFGKGKSFTKEFEGLFDDVFKKVGDGFVESLLKGEDPLKSLNKAAEALSGSFSKTAGDIDKIVDGIGKLAGFDINKSFQSATGSQSTLGQLAVYGEAGYQFGNLAESALGGTDTKSGEYAAAGATIGGLAGPVGAAIGGGIGTIIGGFIADWNLKDAGIIIDDGVIKEWEKFEKDRIFGFADKTRTKIHEASQATIDFFRDIEIELNEMGEYFDKDFKLNLSGKISFKDFDEEVARAILDNFAKADDYGGIFSSAFSATQNSINESEREAMLAHFTEYAKTVDKTVTEVIIEAFEKETAAIDALQTNLEAAFGDYGEKIGESIENIFKHSSLETLPDFDKRYSDILLRKISGIDDSIAYIWDRFKTNTLNAVDRDALIAELNASFAEMDAAWESWAAKQGMSVVDAINAGLQSVAADKAQFESFFNDYFDLGDSIEVLRQKAVDASATLQSSFDELGQSFNLQNFAELRDAAMKSMEFTPENIESWHEAQMALENAATSTRAFAEALGGLVAKYDTAIQSFDQVIADFQGIELQKAEDQQMTIDAINNLANTILAETDNEKQLELSADFIDAIKQLDTEQDARFQAVVEGNKVDTEALALEFSQTLAIGLDGLAKDITSVNQELLLAQEAGDDEAVTRLNEQLQILTNQQDKLEDIATRADNEGLSAEIATEFQKVNDIAFAQMTEDVKAGLVESQASLEELQAEANAYLQAIEGTLKEGDPTTKQLTEQLVNWNMTAAEADAAIKESLGALPEDIGTSLTTAVEPLGTAMTNVETSMAALPEQIGTGLTTAVEPLTQTTQTMSDSIATLPDSFNAAIEPLNTTTQAVVESVAALPEGFNAALQPVADSIGTLPDAFNTAIQPVVESVATLPDAFNTALQPVTDSLATLPTQIDASLQTAMQPVSESLSILPQQIDASIQGVTLALENSLATGFGEMTTNLNNVSNEIQTMNNDFAQQMTSMSNEMAQNLTAVNNTFEKSIATLNTEMNNSLRDLNTSMSNDMQNLGNDITQNLQTLNNELSVTLQTNFAQMGNELGEVTQSIANMNNAMTNSISEMNASFDANLRTLSADINTSLSQVLTPINNIMTEMNTTVKNLPGEMDASFQATLAPVVTSLGDVTKGIDNLDEAISAAISVSMQPMQTAMNQNTSAVQQLQQYEARSAAAAEGIVGAINSASSHIASAVSGAVGSAIDAANRAADYAAQASNAASSAAGAAAAASNSISTINGRLSSIESNTRQTVVQTSQVAKNTGAA